MLEPKGPNAAQIQFWNETAGLKWVNYQETINAHARSFGLLAMDRASILSGERVLDVGCGCGDTTFELARRVGKTGELTGIDLSSIMLARARESAEDLGSTHVRFINADAQTYAFQPQSFDLLYSRFGIMFFTDPQAAFGKLLRALRPGGRFAFVCWQEFKKNLWAMVPTESVTKHIEVRPSIPDAPGPFAFANVERLGGVLSEVGFHQIAFEESVKDVPVSAGGDLDAAVDFLYQMGPAAAAIRHSGQPEKRGVLLDALREAVAPYQTPQGVHMQAAAWIVTGCRP